jgi:hypothetical protein
MKKLNLTLALLATTTAFASGASFDSEQVGYLYTDEPCPKVAPYGCGYEYQPFEPFDYSITDSVNSSVNKIEFEENVLEDFEMIGAINDAKVKKDFFEDFEIVDAINGKKPTEQKKIQFFGREDFLTLKKTVVTENNNFFEDPVIGDNFFKKSLVINAVTIVGVQLAKIAYNCIVHDKYNFRSSLTRFALNLLK